MCESYNPHLGYESEFIPSNMKLVHAIAKRYRAAIGTGISYEDIVSEGTIGMIRAFRKYDPDQFDGKVNSFATYAVPYIRGYILRFIRDKQHSVRIPQRIHEKASLIRKNGWEEESIEVIAEKTGWGISEVTEIVNYMNGWSVASLDRGAPSAKGDKDITFMDVLPCEEDFSSAAVEDFLDALTPREKRIVELRMDGMWQHEIGEELGISRISVRRLLKKVQQKYIQFQNLESIKEEPKMTYKASEKPKASLSHVVWFVDTVAPAIPTISVNTQGILFNASAVLDMGCEVGKGIAVGLDPVDNRLIIQMNDQGLKLKRVHGSKSLRLMNKRLTDWMKKNKIEQKKYALKKDPVLSVFYAALDRHG